MYIINLSTETDGNPSDEVDGVPGVDEETKEIDKSNYNTSQDQSMGDDEVDYHEEKSASPPLSFDTVYTKVLMFTCVITTYVRNTCCVIFKPESIQTAYIFLICLFIYIVDKFCILHFLVTYVHTVQLNLNLTTHV